MRDIGKAREQALDLAIAGLKRRDERIESAIRIIDETVDPKHQADATYRAVEALAFRRHAVARGDARNVSGQDYKATGKRLRPADAMCTRSPSKRTGLGADRIRASNDKQVSIVGSCLHTRALVASYVNGNAKNRHTLRPALTGEAIKRGITLSALIDSFR